MFFCISKYFGGPSVHKNVSPQFVKSLHPPRPGRQFYKYAPVIEMDQKMIMIISMFLMNIMVVKMWLFFFFGKIISQIKVAYFIFADTLL